MHHTCRPFPRTTIGRKEADCCTGRGALGGKTNGKHSAVAKLTIYCPRVSFLCLKSGSISGNATTKKKGAQSVTIIGPRDRRGRFAYRGCFQRGLSTMLTTLQTPMARNDDNTSTIPRRLRRQRAAQDQSGQRRLATATGNQLRYGLSLITNDHVLSRLLGEQFFFVLASKSSQSAPCFHTTQTLSVCGHACAKHEAHGGQPHADGVRYEL